MQNISSVLIQDRTSPISGAAVTVTLALAATALITAAWTRLTFVALPNMLLFIAAVFVLDVLSQFTAPTRNIRALQTILYGVLYLVITCFCGVLAAYATQRFTFPFQDRLFEAADLTLGVNWFDLVHWVDNRPVVHAVLKLAYETMPAQIALPVIVLAFSDRTDEVRKYLLSFAIALTITIIVAAFLPAANPVALLDQATFNVLRFTGAAPFDHLLRLRSVEPIIIGGDRLGGILSFPSFHATVAVLTPLTLRHYRGLFIALLILDAAVLFSTVPEGAHYVSDVLAGAGVAFVAYFLAKLVLGTRDCSSNGISAMPPIARDMTGASQATASAQ
jgi:membrane-associated phospholipid phosphatase